MPEPLWLVRPRPDGGCDYVNFEPQPGIESSGMSSPSAGGTSVVEMRQGSHLPPQLPLLKHRRRLDPAEARRWQERLLQEGGFRSSEPLF
ncbi:MAG: hypothetical protein KFB97_06540 [Cyanobium sp. M30B3]|jgi:hypothetical protein|nr:MAG: hypothetical protein KFB97_06540 [Cyanobium sp. M30B3]